LIFTGEVLVKFNLENKTVLDEFFKEIPEVKSGKMFGYPGYYVGGKLFACIYEDGLGLKVPESMAEELRNRDYIDYFQPLGRNKMREWIQINRKKSEDYLKDEEILMASLKYVASLAEITL
jgi:TfoX/Sxy family transcriptional regulator of competence genes